MISLVLLGLFFTILIASAGHAKFRSDLSPWRKKYGLVRYPRIAIYQKATNNSPIVSHILYGQIVNVQTYINGAHANSLPKSGKWIYIKTKQGLYGFTVVDNVLLLDTRQKPIWIRNYTPYQIHSPKQKPVTAHWSKTENFISYQHNNQNSKTITLYPNSIVWCEKNSKTNCFFRYLGHSLEYNIYTISRKNIKKTKWLQP